MDWKGGPIKFDINVTDITDSTENVDTLIFNGKMIKVFNNSFMALNYIMLLTDGIHAMSASITN